MLGGVGRSYLSKRGRVFLSLSNKKYQLLVHDLAVMFFDLDLSSHGDPRQCSRIPSKAWNVRPSVYMPRFCQFSARNSSHRARDDLLSAEVESEVKAFLPQKRVRRPDLQL